MFGGWGGFGWGQYKGLVVLAVASNMRHLGVMVWRGGKGWRHGKSSAFEVCEWLCGL